ncbi:MAG: LytTR family DNA-binding domain-containing protein [Pyrinomonadaceae bacterium]
MNLKAIIVDDERLARKELRSLLAEFEEISVAGEAEDLDGAVELVGALKPDVIFLDIQLANENGFDLLERIEKTFKLIFVTAFDQFAIRAFEINALDYLLKPVNPERLAKAIERLSAEDETPAGELRKLEIDDRLFVDQNERTCFIKIAEISHITAAGDYTEVFTVGGRKFLIEKPLREWEERLPEKNFTRIHRSAIINLDRIDQIETWFNRTLRVSLEGFPEKLSVSRRYAAKLKDRFA